jgi:hypothetical protein
MKGFCDMCCCDEIEVYPVGKGTGMHFCLDCQCDAERQRLEELGTIDGMSGKELVDMVMGVLALRGFDDGADANPPAFLGDGWSK